MEDAKASNTKSTILLDQVDDLYRNAGYANLSAIFLSLFLIWVLWPVSSHDNLLYWAGTILFISVLRHTLTLLYRQSRIDAANAPGWVRLYIACVLCSGMAWGTLLVFVVPVDKTVYLLTTIFMLCGLITASAATLTSLKFGFAFFSVPAILPGALYFMYLNKPITYLLGCALITFLVGILFIALRIHKTLYYSLKKQIDVSNKLSVLEAEKQELSLKLSAMKDRLERDRAELEGARATLNHKKSSGSLVRRANNFMDERFICLLDSLKGGVWDMKVKSGEMVFSKGWLEMLGYDQEQNNKNLSFWESILHPDDRLNVLNKLQAFEDGSLLEFASSHRLKACSGEWVWVMARAHGAIWGPHGELLNIVGMELHVPESGEEAGKSLNLLNFDINTWLSSPEIFNTRLLQLIKTASVEGIEHSLFHIRIIEMSDQRGTSASLEEICQYEVGRVLLNECRNGDAIIRLPRDSFALLMAFSRVEDAWGKAVSLQKRLRNLKINFKGTQYSLAVGIGITPVLNTASSCDELMKDAETACDLAINKTSNLIYVYQKDNKELGSNIFEKHLVKKIRDCLDQDSIRIVASPLQTLSPSTTNASTPIFSVYVDLDWDEHEVYSGADFTSIALRNELSTEIDSYVVSHVARWLKLNAKNSLPAETIYFYQCSADSCLDPNFHDLVRRELSSVPKGAGTICFGITENDYCNSAGELRQFMSVARASGCRIALTNFSNIALINSIVEDGLFDYLKIDSGLIRDMEKNKSSAITVRYINEIIHLAGLKSIAEDVSNNFKPDTLYSVQVDFVQSRATASTALTIK